MSEYYKRIEKKLYFDTSRIDTIVMAHHIVSVASSPGWRLVRAMWLCRGLRAKHGVEKSKSKIKNGSSKN